MKSRLIYQLLMKQLGAFAAGFAVSFWLSAALGPVSLLRQLIFSMFSGLAALIAVTAREGGLIFKKTAAIEKISHRVLPGPLRKKSLDPKADEMQQLRCTVEALTEVMAQAGRRREEESTRASAILDRLSEGVLAVDGRSRILLSNRAAENLLGFSGEVVGKSLLELTRHDGIEKLIKKAMEEHTVLNEEIEQRDHLNRVFKIQAIGTREPKAGVRGILVFSDISEVRHLENLRRQFVANVSHELRTPLTSIRGFIETLLDGAQHEADKRESFLKIMEADASRLTRLIDGLLELSKIESKQLPLKRETYALGEQIRQAVSVCGRLAEEKKVRIENRAGEDLQVLADRPKIEQVLVNILENAIKYSYADGKVEIDSEAASDKVWVHVRDHGIGIPEEAQPRIFERFFRVDKARSRALGGTGLGLSIVKHILESHGEQVICQSEPGRGSRFSFSLSPVRGCEQARTVRPEA